MKENKKKHKIQETEHHISINLGGLVNHYAELDHSTFHL